MKTHDINWSQEVTRARSSSGMTVEELAKEVCIRPSLLGAIERGQLLPNDGQAAQLLHCLQLAAPPAQGALIPPAAAGRVEPAHRHPTSAGMKNNAVRPKRLRQNDCNHRPACASRPLLAASLDAVRCAVSMPTKTE